MMWLLALSLLFGQLQTQDFGSPLKCKVTGKNLYTLSEPVKLHGDFFYLEGPDNKPEPALKPSVMWIQRLGPKVTIKNDKTFDPVLSITTPGIYEFSLLVVAQHTGICSFRFAVEQGRKI